MHQFPSKVKMSKVKVTRPLWVAVQVTTCRRGNVVARPHYRPHSLYYKHILCCQRQAGVSSSLFVVVEWCAQVIQRRPLSVCHFPW